MINGLCRICGQIAGDPENDLLSNLFDDSVYVRRVVLETKDFAVIPSVGPLVEGHVLLCPNNHFRSIASISVDLDDGLDAIRGLLRSRLERAYGLPIHLFEHGNALHGKGIVCSVEHAHLHFVPSRAEVWLDLQRKFDWRAVGAGQRDLRVAVGEGEYLYYESPNGEAFVSCEKSGGFESQIIRRSFASVLGIEARWNWRGSPELETVSKTFDILQANMA